MTDYELSGSYDATEMTSVQYFGESSYDDNQMGGDKPTPGQFDDLQAKFNPDTWETVKSSTSYYYVAPILDASPVYHVENYPFPDQTWRVRNWTEHKVIVPLVSRSN